MSQFSLPGEFPPIFDQFNGYDNDDGAHPILSMCIRETVQ
jgi:hypothetical protein